MRVVEFPPFRLSSKPNPILGFNLVEFAKLVRNQRDSNVKHYIRVFRCVSLAFCEFQSLEHRLERISDESCDGAASSYGFSSNRKVRLVLLPRGL